MTEPVQHGALQAAQRRAPAPPPGANPTPSTEPQSDGLDFDLRGLLEGVRLGLPIALSVGVYGLVLGVLAQQRGLSIVEVLLMSGTVFAGAAQFVVLGLWTVPLPFWTIVLTTLVVNLRHLLMGAALSPWLTRLPPPARYGSLFVMADESWALTMGALGRGSRNGALLLGCGLTLYVAWVGSTTLGRILGSAVQDPARWGLDFAFTAIFLALLVGLWRGKGDLLPWLVAAVVAVAAEHWLPGKWYILLGGLAGSLAGGGGANDAE